MTPGEAEPSRTPAWGRSVQHFLRAAVGPGEPGTGDGELLARFVQSRDAAAFELLVWRHGAMVLRAAEAVVRDHHLAEDVTQATFLLLAKQAGSLREPDAVVGWLYVTARRLALRARKLRRPTVPLPESAGVVASADSWPMVEEEVARLPEKYRLPVLLCYYEGLTHEEAAVRLGRPVGTVAGWLARAKVRLHDRLVRRGFPLPAVGLVALAAVERLDASLVEAVLSSVSLGLVSTASLTPTVLTLVHGAIRDMTILKLKYAAASLLAAGSVGLGGWVTVNAQQGGAPSDVKGPSREFPELNPKPPAAAPRGDVVTRVFVGELDRPLTLAQSRRSMANLRAILVGYHNYHDTLTQFPTDITDAKTFAPLLSWRVAILPYIGQEKLYKEFKLTEPWDSEHNLKLLAKMPDVYRGGFEAKDSTHTWYQIVAAPGTAFLLPVMLNRSGAPIINFGPGVPVAAAPGITPAPLPPPGGVAGIDGGADGAGIGLPDVVRIVRNVGVGTSFASITDGSSSTFAVLECGPAVPWTKPADLTGFTWAAEPLAGGMPSGGLRLPAAGKLPAHWVFPFGSVFHVATADGVAHALKRDLTDGLFAALLTAAGGEVVDMEDVRRTYHVRLPATTAEDKAVVETMRKENGAKLKEIDEAMKALLESIRKAGAADDFYSQEELRGRIEYLKNLIDNQNREPAKK